MLPVVVICAPTACGKTDLAYNLFSHSSKSTLSGKAEIISADSMQVYKYMDIGTAKPDKEFLKDLPHHLIDMCTPDYQFGVGDFVRSAKESVQTILSNGKIPIILGGTAFYIKNFVYGLPTTPRVDDATRILVENRMQNEGAQKLWDELYVLDKISAEKIHINDEYRIKRALEVCIATGLPRSSFHLPQGFVSGYNFLILSLVRSRSELYERAEMRVDSMMDMGLENEVLQLKKMGFSSGDPGMQAIGYREFFEYDNINQIKDAIVKNTKEYIKRQQTFFKSFQNASSVNFDDFSQIEEKIVNFYECNNLST